MASTSSEHTVRLAARAALEKKAAGLVVLDLQGISGVADFFLVCSAQSSTQIDTIADAIQVALKAAGVRARHREGTAKSGWLLLDYGDVVCHVFRPEARTYYALEDLWADAPRVVWRG